MMARRYIPVGLLVLCIVLLQAVMTLIEQEYYLTQFTMSAYYCLVILGLTVLMGYAGQISMGHAAFFAMGGYATAVLTTFNLVEHADSPVVGALTTLGLTVTHTNYYGVEIMHVTPWCSLIGAVVITAFVAFVIGIPILRLKGHYLAMATLGFGIIIYRIVLGTGMCGEADGISDVPRFTLMGPLAVSGDASMRVQNYYIAFFLVVGALVLLMNLVESRVGRALRSIHGSEEAASAMGVDVARYKLSIFVLSAVFSCVAGVFMTHFNGGIGPSEAGVMKSVTYVAIVAVRGMANLWGALSMGIVLNYLSLRGYFGSYDELFFGCILIVIMLFFPDGLLQRKNMEALAARVKGLMKRERRA
jgi:branched-chain amino acid transport system permease protein